MTETKSEEAVEAAAPETKPAHKAEKAKPQSVTTGVWCEGKSANREALFRQAIVNVRDAVPVMAYSVSCEVKGTKAKTVDKVEGHVWEVEVTFTPRDDVPSEPVDLDKVITEAQAGYGDTHPGDPNFGKSEA